MQIILTHSNADFDGVGAMLAAHKLYPDAIPYLPRRLNHNVAEFMALYQNGLPFRQWQSLNGPDVERVIMVDTQRRPEVYQLRRDTPLHIFDHHPQKQGFGDHVELITEPVGAATTLLVERIQAQHIPISSLEATLLALGVYSDTGSLTYGTTTARDIRVVAWLLEQQAVLDTIRRFLTTPLNEDQLELFDALVHRAETRVIHGCTVTIAAYEFDHYVEQVNSITHRLRSILDPDALFVLVKMPKRTQMVARSRTNAVDVGGVARLFGGGGHARAAAAKLNKKTLDNATEMIWAYLEQQVQPQARVAHLMSFGVQTVNAEERLKDVIHWMRRIGHEGFPVLSDGQLVGLLTRRDADRALEHGLNSVTVGQVMIGGSISLQAQDSVAALERLMVESGWGQIPVVNEDGVLTGIVTRTDLIKHWVQVHPDVQPEMDDTFDLTQIRYVLGAPLGHLLDALIQFANEQNVRLYLVGGVVRDLLLQRPNDDIDFVVEEDAITFAGAVSAALGGKINVHLPFGTAKWSLDETVAERLGLSSDHLPAFIDFATSRNEFYLHPTALPSVYNSSIKLDLHRRDFTINTLAIQLSPERAHLLDFYGGLNDLKNQTIRVLHSLSFVDDPTRILRAVRFEQRLNFTIEPRTAELVQESRWMLRRITGERVKNELRALLREPEPERGLRVLDERGILEAIHPALAYSERTAGLFRVVRGMQADWPVKINLDQQTDFYWHVWMIQLKGVGAVCDRLLIDRRSRDDFVRGAQLMHNGDDLCDRNTSNSAITRKLNDIPERVLLALWLSTDGVKRERLSQYLNDWRHISIRTDGHRLRELGVEPGPIYRAILNRLLDARLNGLIATDNDEAQMLQQILDEGDSDGV